MTRSPLQRALIAVAVAGMVPFMAACPKKPPPPMPDADIPVVVVDAAPNILEPIGDDAGFDAGFDAGHHYVPGKPADALTANIKRCCGALSAQSKANGNPPELQPAVQFCATLIANPNAPELNTLRPLLKMAKTLPPACQGL
jgi:hypothetical protein